MCAHCPALEYQNAEDAVENIPRRHWENSRHVPHRRKIKISRPSIKIEVAKKKPEQEQKCPHPCAEEPQSQSGDISFYASNKQQARLEQRPTKERGLEHRRSRANRQSSDYSARIQCQTRGKDQEPVNILDSRWPFQIQFEIKDTATGQTSRQSGAGTGRAGKIVTVTVGFGQRTDQATEKQFQFDLYPTRG
ncbi:hypothetical protein HPB52_019645 [Rhipicephalus sanguineus]|uniref:Uncharacterized protein n=1 Tax=Rhipicephalus sanguineus TaxID=34632 RepID=A0A9D4PKD6_RHISA|nr:hypothetical protein HPB52_019645 [Rhipicephalus sanguineus]